VAEPPSLGSVAGSLHAALISEQVAEERASKGSLEQRALAVITTSSALATLLIGLAAFARQAPHLHLDTVPRWLIVGAAAAFLIAAILSLVVIIPRDYKEASPKALDERIMRDRWTSTDVVEEARQNAVLYYHTLKRARDLNGCKATLLFLAVIAEVVAVLSAGLAAALTVLGAP
jgi:hypothetical protein